MKQIVLQLAVAGSILLCIVSCAGAPVPQEPPASPQPAPAAPAPKPQPAPPQDPDLGPPTQEALDQLNAAKSRVETSRQQAIDIESSSYAPDGWLRAEDQYASVKEQAKESTLGEVKEAVGLYNAAAEAYDDAARRSVPLYAQALVDEALKAREAALEAGIESLSPDRLAAAGDYALRAVAKYKEGEPAGNYYEAADNAFQALYRYRSMRSGAQAYYIREEILKRDFVKYDADNCALAEASLFEAIDAYDTGNLPLAQEGADKAFLQYNLALKTGWESYTDEQRTAALQMRQAAVAAKANVAAKGVFNPADGLFTRGENSLKADKYPEAVDFYIRAIPQFVTARKLAEEKRIVAEQAIETAEKRVQVSDDTAREAELLLGEGAAQ
jgi:hypothetical protein